MYVKRVWTWFKSLPILGKIGLIIALLVVGSLATYALSDGVKQKPKDAGPKAKKAPKKQKPKKQKPKGDGNETKKASQKLVSEQSFKQYEVRIYQDTERVLGEGSLEILKNGQRVYTKEGGKFQVGSIYEEEKTESLIPMGKDITGDKIPDLVISEFTGGAHCCSIFYIFSIGDKFKLIADIDAEDGDQSDFENLDGDNNLEFVTNDWTFAYWKTSFAESPAPKIILRYKDGAYHLASELMKTPPPKPEEMRRKAQEVKNDERWHDEMREIEERIPSSLWGYMLDLIYRGHKELARQFVDMAWPENKGGKEEFLEDFESQLSKSPYWPEVMALSK